MRDPDNCLINNQLGQFVTNSLQNKIPWEGSQTPAGGLKSNKERENLKTRKHVKRTEILSNCCLHFYNEFPLDKHILTHEY